MALVHRWWSTTWLGTGKTDASSVKDGMLFVSMVIVRELTRPAGAGKAGEDTGVVWAVEDVVLPTLGVKVSGASAYPTAGSLALALASDTAFSEIVGGTYSAIPSADDGPISPTSVGGGGGGGPRRDPVASEYPRSRPLLRSSLLSSRVRSLSLRDCLPLVPCPLPTPPGRPL